MSILYTCPLENKGENSFIQEIIVGTITLRCKFQWAVASEEQLNSILSNLVTLAQSDPLVAEGNYVYDYNYLDYYMGLDGVNLNDWLDTNPVLPKSIKDLTPRFKQIEVLRIRIEACKQVNPIVQQLIEVLRWQVSIDYGEGTMVTVIQPGGWYHNQDNVFALRYVTDREYIGKEDLSYVTLEIEVF